VKVKQGVGHQLGRYPAGPVRAEPVVAVVEIPLVPGAEPPSRGLEFFLIFEARQFYRPCRGQVHVQMPRYIRHVTSLGNQIINNTKICIIDNF
jgi:hypothetical protein